MPYRIGTRTKVNQQHGHIQQGSMTKFYTRDVGLTTNVTASITFTANTMTGANGTFLNTLWPVNAPIFVEGVNLNNGYFTITGLDNTNSAFLTVDPSPKAEGPISATVRTV
jgi:hypothetical protein